MATNHFKDNPYSYFYDTVPLLKSCTANQNQASRSCTCTDPSWIYQNPCKLKENTGDNSGRTRCYFGNQTQTQSGPVPTNNGSFTKLLKDGATYKIGTTTSLNQPYYNSKNSGTFIGGNESLLSKYPLPALVCSTHGDGDAPEAQPTPAKPNISINSGKFNGSWGSTTYQNQFKGQDNLGFEKRPKA